MHHLDSEVPTEGPEILKFLEEMVTGKVKGKTVRLNSARDVGVFGWLLENGKNGSFVRAYYVFEQAIEIVFRLCFVSAGVEPPPSRELQPHLFEHKPVDPFIEYAHTTYPKAIEQIQIALMPTDFKFFSNLALKFLFIVEKDVGKVAVGENNDHKRQVMSKMCQELMAFVWCLKSGSLHSCFHHLRSIMEITAIANYFFAEGKVERQLKREKKYYEFRDLSKYQRYLPLKIKLDTKKITQEDFINECIISPEDIESFTEDRINGWRSLWDLDSQNVLDIKNWHFPASIDNLVENAQPQYRSIYHSICHVVHVSPLGVGLAGQNIVLQKNEVHKVGEYVSVASCVFHNFLGILDDWIGKEISTHFASIYEQFSFLQHRQEAEDATPVD